MTTNFFFLYFSRGEYLVYSSYSDTLPPEVLQRQWKKQKFHYDTVPTAMLTLFAVQTTEGWPVYVWLFEILLGFPAKLKNRRPLIIWKCDLYFMLSIFLWTIVSPVVDRNLIVLKRGTGILLQYFYIEIHYRKIDFGGAFYFFYSIEKKSRKNMRVNEMLGVFPYTIHESLGSTVLCINGFSNFQRPTGMNSSLLSRQHSVTF